MTGRARKLATAWRWQIGRWWWLTALVLSACAAPALTASVPGPGVPRITAFAIVPARVESGCPVTLRIDFEDTGADVARAVMRWRARTGYQRYHERTEVVPIATTELTGRAAGHADVVIVPPHAGGWVYRLQLEDAQGRTSNVAEARVDVVIRPFWRRAQCES
jgi:hypothetical protein